MERERRGRQMRERMDEAEGARERETGASGTNKGKLLDRGVREREREREKMLRKNMFYVIVN